MRLDSTKVRRARERVGLSIETAAESSGVAKGSFLRAEHGEEVRPVTARRIASGLGVRVADLVLAEPEIEPTPKVEAPGTLAELLEWAGAETSYLALPDEEYNRLWEGRPTEERATINQAILDEKRRITPWLHAWKDMPAGPERSQRVQLSEFALARMLIATARNYEAARAEAERARFAGNEARAEYAIEQAVEFQQRAAA